MTDPFGRIDNLNAGSEPEKPVNGAARGPSEIIAETIEPHEISKSCRAHGPTAISSSLAKLACSGPSMAAAKAPMPSSSAYP
jgi:hypothetical protein